MSNEKVDAQIEGAANWWSELKHHRGDWARVRRLDAEVALADPNVIRLYRKLFPQGGAADWQVQTAIRLALVLAHVRDDASEKFGRSLGPSKPDENDAALKPLRLRALIRTKSEDDTIRSFRRAIAMKKSRVNVREIARLLLNWNLTATRTRLAFDYFDAPDPSRNTQTN